MHVRGVEAKRKTFGSFRQNHFVSGLFCALRTSLLIYEKLNNVSGYQLCFVICDTEP